MTVHRPRFRQYRIAPQQTDGMRQCLLADVCIVSTFGTADGELRSDN